MTDQIIFDCDGVIVDSWGGHVELYADFARENGFELRASDLERAIDGSAADFWKNMGVPDKFVGKLYEVYDKRFRDYEVHVFPGVVDMLSCLKSSGKRLSMATFNRRCNLEGPLKECFPFFDKVLTYEDARKGKVLNKAYQLENLSKFYRKPFSDFRLVGDTRWDFDAAKEMGIDFVGVNYGWGNFEEGNGFPVVDGVAELWEFLEKN